MGQIVEDLIAKGLTVEAIQDAYDRYVWHVNHYEPKLKAVEAELQRYKDQFGELPKRQIAYLNWP